ncbi:tetratricopeptide repeat protein 5 [Ambystoma mexicanum]|uniref:tetratricopeptide repeat protein 5 n=1 Tax=Ambystoma mexicanum TaxID=8296 RepID=UPI0037E81142
MEAEAGSDQALQELVDRLYHFRDHYFDTHSVEDAGRKQQDVADELAKTLLQVQKFEGCVKNKSMYLLQKGKALNVTAEYSREAEEALAKSVKLDPGLVEAWNHLGEVYWKKGDITSARTCFSGALNHCKNKVSLRNLSMVLRQVHSEDGDARSQNVMESVKHAKEAVQMDVQDGTSWYILGNAYLSLFFSTGQTSKISQQALNSYAKAEKVDPTATCNPDLHLNRATLHTYEESYAEALKGYARAAQLDPAWPEPALREQQLLDFVSKLNTLLMNKGKVKAKKLQSMLGSLKLSHLGPCADGNYQTASGKKAILEQKPLSALVPGTNGGSVVLGKVVFSLTTEQKIPFTFGLVDMENSCYAVMVYNMAESWGVLIGDSVAIPEPHLKHQEIQHKGKTFAFRSLRVETPLLLVVNGKAQSASCQAAATVVYRPQSE